LKKVKAAKLRRPAPGTGYPAPHLRRPLAAVTPVDEALAGLRAGLPAMQVAEALRGTWRKQMTELLAPEVLSGRLALDDYLTIVEGRGHGAA
jgi:hypothetical protein